MKYDIKKIKADPNLPGLDSEPIKQVLGDAMPELPLSKVGRLRLVSALSYKYGANFRNFEGSRKALDHFDDAHDTLRTYLKLKGHVRG